MLGPISSSSPSHRPLSPSPSSLRTSSSPSSSPSSAPSSLRPAAPPPVDTFERFTSSPNPSSAPRSSSPPLPAAAPAPVAPARDLGPGSTGADVEQLQRGLVALGHLSQTEMNTGPGTFGPRTQAALREFQTKSGVSPTGFYGPMTRTALGTALAQRAPTSTSPTAAPTVPPPGLVPGASGPQVEQLQRALVAAGAMTQADMDTGPGTFGPRTEAAVRSFQAKNGLPQTGYYGPQTNDALSRALGAPSSTTTDASGVPPEKTSVIGAPLGDGTAEGALTWSKDQMPGGTLLGQNHMMGNANSVGNPARWDSWCLGFVNNAYGQKVPELRMPAAIDSFHAFNDQGRIDTNRSSIPAGAPVYFDANGNNSWYGHIAIATGKTTPSGEPIIRSTGWAGHSGIFEAPLSELEAACGAPYLGYAVM
jgi:peptidoglycan hydrolase-like protein with peptidoglycan-binding domain